MSLQSQLIRERLVILTTESGARVAPTDRVTSPDIQLGPVSPEGLPTTGFQLMIDGTSTATPTDEEVGFTLTVWERNPITGSWGAWDPVSILARQWFVSFDAEACELYFQIGDGDTDGSIILHVSEL